LAANSVPSVAIRMCLYTRARSELGSQQDWVLSASPPTVVLLCGGVLFTLTCVKARVADRLADAAVATAMDVANKP
jgi:hypothetical protein